MMQTYLNAKKASESGAMQFVLKKGLDVVWTGSKHSAARLQRDGYYVDVAYLDGVGHETFHTTDEHIIWIVLKTAGLPTEGVRSMLVSVKTDKQTHIRIETENGTVEGTDGKMMAAYNCCLQFSAFMSHQKIYGGQ